MNRLVLRARSTVLLQVCLTLVVLSFTFPAEAQIEKGDLVIALEPVASRLASPVAVTHAGDGSGRLFIVDQAGVIRIVEDGVLLAEPFLDLTSEIVELNPGFDERGVLGLAFHPDYDENGRFFVRYSAPRDGEKDEPCFGPPFGCHTEVLSEFAVSKDDPNVADAESELVLYEAVQPQFNHDAGTVAFGPDGFLYFTLGDGGGANDGLADDPPSHGETGHGQNLETALGSMLRIDVDGESPFAIPDDNPFVDEDGLDEIWAYGFRNPFKFSFDRGGDRELVLADVGQDLFEEVNIVEKGGNYGWVIREAAHCFDPLEPGKPPEECETEGLIDPIAEYDHSDGLAVVGGFVYRGKNFPELVGKYVFGDFSRDFGPTGRLFYIDMDGDRSEILEFQIGPADAALGATVKGFGEDEDGEIYLCTSPVLGPLGTSGEVFRIVVPRAFVRGDVDGDEEIGLDDALLTLRFLFQEGPDRCRDAMDFNDDGRVALGDAIRLLNRAFLEGAPPAAPFPDCGFDDTVDDGVGGDLGCREGVECE